MFLRAFARTLADLVWPHACAVETCGRLSDRDGRFLCSHCLATLPFHEAGGACRVCGALVAAPTRHDFVCEACQKRPPAFALARSAVRYAEPVDQLLQDFKFRRATWLCEDLADLLEGTVRAKMPFAEIDVVVPVPLHPNRARRRGYNQSELLARALARRLNRRVDCAALARVRDTAHQARLGGEARLANMRDAVAVVDARGVRGRTVLLVDDIMTSGATLTNCARPLVGAGAARVWCATVARAILDNP